MRILLIAPYKNDQIRIGQYISPPIGLYRIKSYIEKYSDTIVDVIDIDLRGEDFLIQKIRNEKYDIIGFSILQPTLKNDLRIINSVSKIAQDSLLLAGGQGAVFNYNFLLKNTPLSIIVKGFGEFPMLEIVKKGLKNLKKVKGIYLKTQNSEQKKTRIIETKLSKPYTYEQFRDISLSFDFSKVPFPDYWNLMKKIYTPDHLKAMKNEDLLYTIRIMTSSHCPKKCIFCSSTNFLDCNCAIAQKRIALNAEDIKELVLNAKASNPNCKSIYFNDDDFLFDKNRIERLCEILPKNISYFCLSRTDNVDRNILKKLKHSNFKFIIFGVESFSNKILSDMCKNMCSNCPRQLSVNTIQKTIEQGITPLMNLIIFFPTTTINEIIETIEHAIPLIESGARLTAYGYVEVYPGSNILKQNHDLLNENVTIENNTFSIPKYILPDREDIRILAKNSLIFRDKLVNKTLDNENWSGVVPHPIHSLCLFLAIYKLLNKDTSRIENLIKKIFNDARQENLYSNSLTIQNVRVAS